MITNYIPHSETATKFRNGIGEFLTFKKILIIVTDLVKITFTWFNACVLNTIIHLKHGNGIFHQFENLRF